MNSPPVKSDPYVRARSGRGGGEVEFDILGGRKQSLRRPLTFRTQEGIFYVSLRVLLALSEKSIYSYFRKARRPKNRILLKARQAGC